MSTSSIPDASKLQSEIAALFQAKGPVLVEVRFPHMGTSSDWYLCEEEAELRAIVGRLGTGAEIHLLSVWDLRNTGPDLTWTKQ